MRNPSRGIKLREARAKKIQDRYERYQKSVGEEFPASFYDDSYLKDRSNPESEYYKSPKDSAYYPLWTKVLEMVSPESVIADFGCGNGQFANLAISEGKNYRFGIDFSKEAIEWAKVTNPTVSGFMVKDLLDPETYDLQYDTAICLETLEHLNEDLFLMEHFKKDCQLILSVPSYALSVHVRHFEKGNDVLQRYRSYVHVREFTYVDINPYRRIWILSGRVK